jgi:hypothetical protein
VCARTDLDVPTGAQEDVLWLQVAVEEVALVVAVAQRVDALRHDLDDLGLAEAPARLGLLFDQRGEVAASSVLHHNAERRRLLERRYEHEAQASARLRQRGLSSRL